MNVFTVYDTHLRRIRLGSKRDGGYVIFDGLQYDHLVSGGIEGNIDFESDFINKYNVSCDAFDNSIDKLPKENNQINFCRKTITSVNTERNTNLKSLINGKENVFVKMDIEGGEWDWLESLEQEELNRVTQMTIEIHFFFELRGNDLNTEFRKRLKIIEKLNEYFYLMHVHGNNHSNVFSFDGQQYPSVIECTYVNKKVFMNNPYLFVIRNIRNFPNELDMSNNEHGPEINYILNKPPFKFNELKLIYLLV